MRTSGVLLSVVVPAWNEEGCLPRCLEALHSALQACAGPGRAYELIVVDNNSTDATAAVAHAGNARVVFEPVNQIARARNAGGQAARGEWLLFIDADSEICPGLASEIWGLIEGGRVIGAGSTLRMEAVPWWGSGLVHIWNLSSRLFRWAAGALLLCRRQDFVALEGFSNTLYAAEEIDFSRRLKRRGRGEGLRFEILNDHPLLTSSRKLRLYSGREIAAQLLRLALRPWSSLRNRKRLGVWYDGRRER